MAATTTAETRSQCNIRQDSRGEERSGGREMGRSGQGNGRTDGRTDLRPEKRSGELSAAPTDGPTEGRSAHSDITNRLASNLFPLILHLIASESTSFLTRPSIRKPDNRQSTLALSNLHVFPSPESGLLSSPNILLGQEEESRYHEQLLCWVEGGHIRIIVRPSV